MKVLVLGGKGFVGRHAVEHLADSGAAVTIGTRAASAAGRYPQERLLLHARIHERDWRGVVGRFDVVLNCVGILRQRVRETYVDRDISEFEVGHRERQIRNLNRNANALGFAVTEQKNESAA